MSGKVDKTQRILSIYYLLRHCDEVSMQEIANQLDGSKKTFSRDIAILKKAGVKIKYSIKRQAFVLEDLNLGKQDFTGGKSEVRFIKKIIRLITVMDDAPEIDCDIWYGETFPNTSKRTMQRDFAILNSFGYSIKYEREAFNLHDAGYDLPINHYYCDRPNGAYELTIFKGV